MSRGAVAAAPPAVRPRRRSAQLLLIANPRASRLRRDGLRAVTAQLRGAFTVTPMRTEGRGHATELAREAAGEGFDVVAVLGGDGTTNEAAAGLLGSPTPLACLPAGVTNVFARSIGTPRAVGEAARRLAEGGLGTRAVDVGTVDGRPFLCTAGIGLSASMVALADAAPGGKARLGQLHFARAAASEVARTYLRRPPRMRAEAAGRTAEGITAVVQNAHVLTYFGSRAIQACPGAGLDEGAISVTLLRRARARDVPAVVARLLAGDAMAHPEIEGLGPVRAATIGGLDGALLPVEADGEYLGHRARVEVGVAPGALRVLA